MAVSVSSFGSADYYRDHAIKHREAAIEAGGYFVGASSDGEPPAVFLGLGLMALGVKRHESPERADEVVKATWSNLGHPITGEVLGSAPRRYASSAENLAKAAERAGVELPAGLRARDFASARRKRAEAPSIDDVKLAVASVMGHERADELAAAARKTQREAVAMYDVTYSVDKSISVFHVAAERAGDQRSADACEDSLIVGAEAMTNFIQSQLAWTRTGHHGKKVGGVSSGRREQVREIAAAAFKHHTSREGDCQDHVHTAVLNRAICADDNWRALDGAALYDARGALNVIASRHQEAYLRDTLGLVFEPGDDGTRRIAGVDRGVCDMFSKRRAVIEERLRDWAVRYKQRHGREPSKALSVRVADKIAQKTRRAKVHGMTRELSVDGWDKEAFDVRGASLDKVYRSVKDVVLKKARLDEVDTRFDGDDVINRALEALNARQNVWNRYHLIAEIDRQLPANITRGTSAQDFINTTVLRLTAEGLRRSGIVCLVPDQVIDQQVPADMADRNGLSLYLPRGAESYVDAEVLDTEAGLLREALRCDAPRLSREKALGVAQNAGLDGDQADALVGILSSGRSLETLIGPAGTGKSYTLSKLAGAWTTMAGENSVVGLTVSQNAAEVLVSEGFSQATNMSRWFQAQSRLGRGRVFDADRAFKLGKGHLIVVDEGSMASSTDLARVVELARSHGAKVLVTGDHRQLAAIEQGGALGLLATDPVLNEVGAVHELKEVRRFVQEWERSASLRLRSGDETVFDLYEDYGRIVHGTAEEIEAEAVDDEVAHHLAGRTSVLSVGTTDAAAALSMRIRAGLIDAGRVDAAEAVGLHDGTEASVGDLIQARQNEHNVVDSDGVAISNRDVLVVKSLGLFGSITAQRVSGHGSGATVELGRSYVAHNVELAYATTLHAAQGRTVTVGSVLVDPERMTAEALYVGGTRGRATNRVYVPVDPHDDATARDVLETVLGRSGGVRSATEEMREQDDASRSLARIGPVWADALGAACAAEHEQRVLAGFTAALGRSGAEKLMGRIDVDPSAPAFWQAVSATDMAGYDVSDVLASTLKGRNLDGAESTAQVLHHRLTEWRHMAWEPQRVHEPDTVRWAAMTYLERSPEPSSLLADLGRADHGTYARRLAAVMDARVESLGRAAAAAPPEWATKHLGSVPPAGTTEHEDWSQRAGVVAAYREQYINTAAPIDVANPIGRQPSRYYAPQRCIDYKRARSALGLSNEREVDVHKLTDAQLTAHIDAWKQAQQDAPAWVKPLLAEAHREHRRLATRYDTSAARASVNGRNLERLKGEVDAAAERLEQLQADNARRGAWYEDTTEIRDRADEAREELARRRPQNEELRQDGRGSLREEMSEREAQRYDARIAAQSHLQQRDSIGLSGLSR